MKYEILVGDCRESMRSMPAQSVQCCVTSPPYFGLRDYGHEGQIGLEETPEAFVAQLVEVFREVRRVLRDDGTVWLNLGDSYAGGNNGGNWREGSARADGDVRKDGHSRRNRNGNGAVSGCKHKDLIGIPWRVAFALQQDGWYLRQDIIWHKPNPMPESVRDRCTKAHEYIFLLTKSERYFYDADAIAERSQYYGKDSRSGMGNIRYEGKRTQGDAEANGQQSFVTINETRNKRSVWTVATKPYSGAHFATFPPDLIEPCILAGSKPGDTVLDPFGGSGTTGMVALQHGRNAVLCELNPEYVAIAEARISEATAQTDMFLQEAL